MPGSNLILIGAVVGGTLLIDLVFLLLFMAPVIRAKRVGLAITIVDVYRLRRAGLAPALAIAVWEALHAQGVEATLAQIEEVFAANRQRSLLQGDLVHLVREHIRKSW